MARFPFIAPEALGGRALAEPVRPFEAATQVLGAVEAELSAQWEERRRQTRRLDLGRALAEHQVALAEIDQEVGKLTDPDEIEPAASKAIAERTAKIGARFKMDPELLAEFEINTMPDNAAKRVGFAGVAEKARAKRNKLWMDETDEQFARLHDMAPDDAAAMKVEADWERSYAQFGLPEEVLRERRQAWLGGIEKQKLEHLLATNPAAVLALASDPVAFHVALPHLVDAPEMRAEAEGDALGAVTRERRAAAREARAIRRDAEQRASKAMKAQEKATRDAARRELFDMEEASLSDPAQAPAFEQRLAEHREAGSISETDYQTYKRRLNTARKEGQHAQIRAGFGDAIVADSAARRIPVDPSAPVPGTKFKVSDALDARAAEAESEDAVFRQIADTDYVPSQIVSNLTVKAASRDPQVNREAAQIAARIQAESPRAFDSLPKQTRVRLEEHMQVLAAGGAIEGHADAARRADERLRIDPDLVADRSKRFTTEAKPPVVQSAIEAVIGRPDGGIPDELRVQITMRARAIKETEDKDTESALAQAAREVGKGWGMARRGDGTEILMQQPPDRYLPNFDYDAAYAETAEAITALRGTPVDPATLELVPAPGSGLRARPAYFVRENGAIVYDNRIDHPETFGQPVVYELPDPPKPLTQGETARAAMEYLTFRRQNLDGVQPELAGRIEKIREWRGAGGPAEAAATLAIEALSDGDPTLRELSALLETVERQALQSVTGFSGEPY